MSVIKEISLEDLSELYKITYGGFEVDSMWNSKELIGMVKKDQRFVGKELRFDQLQDYGGGQSSGSLPSSSIPSLVQPVLTAKKIYATSVIDNESMRAAKRAGTNEGAFMSATELSMKTLKGSFGDQIARQFMGDGTGTLGIISTVTGLGGGAYDLVINSSYWVQANWMLNDLLNIASGTSLFIVTGINTSTRTITVSRQTGSDIPQIADHVYKQKSKDQEMMGLKGVVDASSSLYGVPTGYRWKAQTLDANNTAPSVKLFRQLDQLMRFESRSDEAQGTDIIMSHTALRLLEDGEDAKSIIYVEPQVAPNRQIGGQVSALKVNGRTMRIHWSPFCEEDRAYVINRNKVSMHLRPDSADDGDVGGFIENGKSIFFPLHVSGTPLDAFQLFYCTFGNLYIPPTFVGCITGLATS